MTDDFSSATANFNARFDARHSEYLNFLIQNKFFRFRNHIAIVMTRFKTLDELAEWVEYVSKNKTARTLEGIALSQYMNACMSKELGL